MNGKLALFGAALAFSLCACDSPRTRPDNQGVTVEPGPCGRGLLVVESDYQSSNVSALGFDGSVLSPSLASSSTEADGFGVGLSGDVVLPASPQNGTGIALIDRYPAGVLRFVDLATARVTSELSVATGFRSNPHDYLALSSHKAYVARYESNPNPGQQAFDQGGDILVVDPEASSISARIDLTSAMQGEPAGFSPHPGQLLQVSGRVFALLASYADDYSSSAVSRLVELDPSTDALLSTLLLDGLHGCDSMAVSPDGSRLAVACTGDDLRSSSPKLDGSGLGLVGISSAPRFVKRFAASDFGTDPVGFGLDFVAPGLVFFGTLGHFDDAGAVAAQDTLLELDTNSAQLSEVLQSQSEPFSLGGVRCAPECGACFAADAERAGGSVLRFPVDGAGKLGTPEAVRAETRVGLPP
ncbi:MAG TPA: hypothetical protein VHW01_21805, partial [Polyangiaceae bacterium]|nr:hypothetical protein [Polyangiaceae bacterium]